MWSDEFVMGCIYFDSQSFVQMETSFCCAENQSCWSFFENLFDSRILLICLLFFILWNFILFVNAEGAIPKEQFWNVKISSTLVMANFIMVGRWFNPKPRFKFNSR
jgi:hypothetical protein